MNRERRASIRNALLLCTCATLPASAQPSSVADFSGIWARGAAAQSAFQPRGQGPGPVMNRFKIAPDAGGGRGEVHWWGDESNPVLKPWAASIVKDHAEGDRAGKPYLTAQQTCSPHGVPFVLQLNDLVQFLPGAKVFAILYSREMRARLIYMNAAHPRNLSPTSYGNSVGHWEGDTLVVDTIGLTDGTWTDRFGTPHTKTLHVVERYHLDDGGKALRVDFTVEDPGAFNAPWSATVAYHREAGPYEEIVCSENNRQSRTADAPPPLK